MADGQVPITAGSGTLIRALTNAAVQGGAYQQVFTIGAPDGTLSQHDPDGTLQVSPEATTLFLDDFSGTLTNNWVTGGTAPTSSAGNVTFNAGTTASATSFMRSIGTFTLKAMTFLRIAAIVAFETSATANSTRWWGYGSNAATPTATAPVTNGAIFMLDQSNGSLYAAVYSAGTRTYQSAALTRPSDGGQHRYEIQYRQSVVFWIIDGNTVATKTFPNLAVAVGLNGIAGAANTATAPGANTFQLSSFSVGDQGGNNQILSDGVLPWLFGTVKQAQVPAIAATDNPLYTLAVPPPSQTLTTLGAAATALTLTLPAPAAGLRHYITGIWMERYISAATTGAATQINSTATNNGLVFSLPFDTQAVGVVTFPVAITFTSPVASTAQATATTFTVPAVTGTVYRITANYYTAP